MTEEVPAAHSPVGVCFVEKNSMNQPNLEIVSFAITDFFRPGGTLIFKKQTAKENYHRQ